MSFLLVYTLSLFIGIIYSQISTQQINSRQYTIDSTKCDAFHCRFSVPFDGQVTYVIDMDTSALKNRGQIDCGDVYSTGYTFPYCPGYIRMTLRYAGGSTFEEKVFMLQQPTKSKQSFSFAVGNGNNFETDFVMEGWGTLGPITASDVFKNGPGTLFYVHSKVQTSTTFIPVVLNSDGTYNPFTWNDDYQFDSLGRTGWTNANSFDRTETDVSTGRDVTTKFHGKFGDGNIQSFKRFFTPLGSGVCVAKYRLHWSDFIENEGIARDYIKIVSSAGASEIVTLQQRGTQPGSDTSHPTWKASNSASGSITMSVIKDEEFSIDFQTQVTQPGWPNLESTWISDISLNCILTDAITCPYATINNLANEGGTERTGITNNRLEITCAGVDIGIQTLACVDRTLFIRNGWDLVTIDCDTYFRACHNLIVYTGSSTTIKCSNLEQCGNMQLYCGYTPYTVTLTALQTTDENNANFDPSCDEDSITEFVANNGYLLNVNAQCQFVGDPERTPKLYCPRPSDSNADSRPECDICNNNDRFPPSRCQFVPTCTQCEPPNDNTPFCNACINNAQDSFSVSNPDNPTEGLDTGCTVRGQNACPVEGREYCCNNCPTKDGECDETNAVVFAADCNSKVCANITTQINVVNGGHKRKKSKIIDGFISHYNGDNITNIYYDWHSIVIITVCIGLIVIMYFIKEIIKYKIKNVNKSQKENNQNV